MIDIDLTKRVDVLERETAELKQAIGTRRCACGCGQALFGRRDKVYFSRACKMRGYRQRLRGQEDE